MKKRAQDFAIGQVTQFKDKDGWSKFYPWDFKIIDDYWEACFDLGWVKEEKTEEEESMES